MKGCCERISQWMDHIDSFATNIDRDMVHGFIEHIEGIFDSRLRNIEKLEQMHEKDVVSGKATQVIGDVWKDALCKQKGVSAQLQFDLLACEKDRQALQEAQRALLKQVTQQEQELQSLRDIARTVDDSVQRCREAENERDIALEKYAYTADLKREVENLKSKLSGCRVALKEQADTNKEQRDKLGRMRVDLDKKNTVLAEGNATAVSLMSVLVCLLDESGLQLQVAKDGLHSLVDLGEPVTVQELELSSLHAKLNHINAFENVLLPKEKEVVVQVMQNVASLRPHILEMLREANKSLASSAEAGETKRETEDIKAWAVRERTRFNKLMEEEKEKSREQVFHLREELAQSELTVKKLKQRADASHREKIELLQTIMELEKLQSQGVGPEAEKEMPSPSTVTSPHLERAAVNEVLNISAHSPSDPKPSGHISAPRRSYGAPNSPEEQLLADLSDGDTGSEGGGLLTDAYLDLGEGDEESG